MSYTLPPSVTSLLAAIDAGEYLTPSSREAAIRQAGGPDFVQLALIRQWLAASGGTAWGAITGTPTDQTDLVTYITSRIVGLLNFKGSTDASANPNYPVALKGDSYLITVAGKIGGASGKVVEVGDMVIADADNAGGTEASVGTSWFVLQANVTGITATGLALIRAANAAAALAVTGGIGGSTGSTDNAVMLADGTGGLKLKASGLTHVANVILPATSGGTDLGAYNRGFGVLRVRFLEVESGSGTSGVIIDQDNGLELGYLARLGFSSAAAASFGNMDTTLTRASAGVLRMQGVALSCAIKTTTYTVDATPGDYTLVGNHATTPFTITMVAASTNTGRILVFKNKGVAAVTVDATALGQIFTTALVNTVVLGTGDSITLQSDGATWNLY